MHKPTVFAILHRVPKVPKVKDNLEAVARFAAFVCSHPANRERRVRSLGRALAWQMWKRAVRRPWDLSVWHGMKIRCHTNSASASLLLYCNGLSDPVEMPFVQHYLRPGDGFLDGGANIGVYSVLAASLVGPAGCVEAFEPGRSALERLRENLALNRLGQVRVHAAALGQRAGRVRFSIDQDSMNHIESDPAVAAVEVPCVTLDEACGHTRYAMAKLDLEGAELLALRGAEGMLAAHNPPVWLLELSPSLHRYGATEEELVAFLQERGFVMASYEPTPRKLTRCPAGTRWDGNFFAVADRAFAAVQARLQGAS